MSSEGRSDRLKALLERVFALVSRLGDEMEGEFEAQGLTRARAELLWRLDAAGPRTQRELSDVLECTPRNVTGLVDALEAADLVRREPHPTDRRASLVTLTKDGRATLAGWRVGYDELALRLFEDVPDRDLRGFEVTIDRILDHLRDPDLADDPTGPGERTAVSR